MKKNKKSNFTKWLWMLVALALAILMIISFSPTRHLTEIVLQ